MQYLSLNMMLPFHRIRPGISVVVELCSLTSYFPFCTPHYSLYILQLTLPVVAYSVFKFQLTSCPKVYRLYPACDTSSKIFWGCCAVFIKTKFSLTQTHFFPSYFNRKMIICVNFFLLSDTS